MINITVNLKEYKENIPCRECLCLPICQNKIFLEMICQCEIVLKYYDQGREEDHVNHLGDFMLLCRTEGIFKNYRLWN